MAEEKTTAPALDTNIESGGFSEEKKAAPPPPKNNGEEEEEEDEDIDALIDDLESQDGNIDEEEEEEGSPGGGRTVPEDMLQTDSRIGLTESEVTARRRKYGLNQMKEEKENLILKFFGYFVGPIQFVMEVCFYFYLSVFTVFAIVLSDLSLSQSLLANGRLQITGNDSHGWLPLAIPMKRCLKSTST